MLNAVKEPRSHSIFFDNLFTAYDLLVYLRHLGFRATGTMRENRTLKCPLQPTNIMKKEPRGSYDYRFDIKEEILLVKWLDNKCVTVATNYDTIEPVGKVQRWKRDIKARGTVDQPKLIGTYNKNMGGVDKHDWLVSKYATGLRGKKWYWPIFTRILDMTIVNAWVIYKSVSKDQILMDLIAFKRYVTMAYLTSNKDVVIRKQSTSRPSKIQKSFKFDSPNHFIAKREQQRRCQNKPCKKRPLTYCSTCLVTLCVACFHGRNV